MEPGHNISAFLRVMHRFGKVSGNPISSTKLTKAEFFCFAGICAAEREHPEHGGIYVWELAQRMQVLPPAASRTLRELEERGYIERSVDREDRRNIRVRLTAEGQVMWTKAEEQMQVIVQRVLDRMGQDNMDQLVTLCDRLCDIIEEEGKQ